MAATALNAMSNGTVDRSTATDAQVARYLEAGGMAKIGIRSAIALLKARQVLTSDPDESREITVQVLHLESALARIQADLIAFSSEQLVIRPPSAQEVEAIKTAARQLDAMVASSSLANAIFGAANTVIQTFAATHA